MHSLIEFSVTCMSVTPLPSLPKAAGAVFVLPYTTAGTLLFQVRPLTPIINEGSGGFIGLREHPNARYQHKGPCAVCEFDHIKYPRKSH